MSGIDRTFQILDYLTERGGPATAYDIAGAIAAATSTVYEIVDALVEKSILVRDEERGQVFLGPKLHFYGLGYIRNLNVSSVFQSAMEKLARDTRETVQICGRDEDRMVVEMMEEGDGHFQVSSRVGTRVPWNWTASGQLLVGYLSNHERARLIARANASPTGNAETDPDKLEKRCLRARARRLAVQINESDFSVACIAAPIVAPGGKCIATISLVVPEARARKNAEDFAVKVRSAAAEIERAMGWDQNVLAADFARTALDRWCGRREEASAQCADGRSLDGAPVNRQSSVTASGVVLPPPPAPIANFLAYRRVGSLLFLSGQGPIDPSGRIHTGKVGEDVDVATAYQHARYAGMNLLSIAREALGDLDRIDFVAKVFGMVNAIPSFADHPKVIDGCSDLFGEVLGDIGRHARSAVGMGSLPGNITVEIEAIFAVKD